MIFSKLTDEEIALLAGTANSKEKTKIFCSICKYDNWPSVYYPCRCCKLNYGSMFERKEQE